MNKRAIAVCGLPFFLLMSCLAKAELPPPPQVVFMNFDGDSSFPSLTVFADTTGLARFTGSAFRLTPEEGDYVAQRIVERVRVDFKDFNIVFQIDPFLTSSSRYTWGMDDSSYLFFEDIDGDGDEEWGRLYGKAGDPGVHPKYARTWAGSFALGPGLLVESAPPLFPYIHCTDPERHPKTGWLCGRFGDGAAITVDHVATALANNAAHEISHLFGALHNGITNPATGQPVTVSTVSLLWSGFEFEEARRNKAFGADNYSILMSSLGPIPPDSPELTSPTHGKGQTSCDEVLTVEWETPQAVRGVGGYSYTIVDQDDPNYDSVRWPDQVINLDASTTSFTTPPLGSGLWEFNILTIDTEGLSSRFYSTFHVDIDSCSVVITRPRSGDSFAVGEWVNIFWEPVTYGGDDVGGAYTVNTIDLLVGSEFVANLASNQTNIQSSGFSVPDVVPGSDYNIRLTLDRNSIGDLFPDLPERFIGFSDHFSISGPPTVSDGDLDGDGDIDTNDYMVFRSALGKCVGDSGFISEADYDGDGCVTYADYRIWYGYYRGSP